MTARRFRISDVLLYLVLVVWGLTILVPLIWTLYVSLKTNTEFFESAWSLPKTPQWDNYVRAIHDLNIGRAMLNTFYYVGLSIVIGIIVTALCAYVLTRIQWKGRKFVWGIVMLSLFLPGINILVPQYVMMCRFGLDNLNGLIFLNSIGLNAFDLMLLGGFMKTIPNELEESAFMDGATLLQTFRSIIVPMSVPGIVTITIFRFIGLYNDFIYPYIYITDDAKYTLGVEIYNANLRMQYNNDWTGLFAGLVIAMIPSLLIYILCQKSIVEGASLGAVKG